MKSDRRLGFIGRPQGCVKSTAYKDGHHNSAGSLRLAIRVLARKFFRGNSRRLLISDRTLRTVSRPFQQESGGTMALIFALVDTWDDGKRIHVTGTVTASGSYATGGDTLDLSQFPVIGSTQASIQGTAWLDGLAGYDYVFTPGAALSAGKVKIFQQGGGAGAFPEMASGAYPAAITGDAITFYGIFKKLA
jgi:hypothetical protein